MTDTSCPADPADRKAPPTPTPRSRALDNEEPELGLGEPDIAPEEPKRERTDRGPRDAAR